MQLLLDDKKKSSIEGEIDRELQKRTGSPVLPTFAETVELSFKTGLPKLHKFAKTVR
jgi:hypothetical protein